MRDAAHEACHALDVGLAPPWTRDRIHDALMDTCENEVETARERMVGYELKARAVEHVVCLSEGVEHDLKQWAATMWLETATSMSIFIPQPEKLPDMILKLTEADTVRAMVARIKRLR